jgi:hypothetical protein
MGSSVGREPLLNFEIWGSAVGRFLPLINKI